MEIFSYLIINLLLFASWYLLLFARGEFLRLSDRLTGAFILGFAQIIVTEMFLGVVLGQLFPKQLFIVNVFISFSVLLLALLHGIKLSGVYCEIKDAASRFFSIIMRDKALLCIFILMLISVSWILFLGYLFPSYTWDSLWYHLPMVGYIMQSGSIQENLATFFIEQFINIFPKNIELFFLWNTIFLNSDAIIDLSQFFFTVIGVFTVYSMARKLGIKEKSAIYSALLFFFTPIIILQSTTNYVDVAVSVLFLVAVNFLLYNNPACFKNNEGGCFTGDVRVPLLLSGISTGILLGSKGSGPLFVMILTAAFMLQEIAGYFSCRKPIYSAKSANIAVKFKNHLKESSVKYIFFFFLPVFLLGGYWYIKNWVIYGSPVYPMEIKFFNFTIFKGLYSGIIDPSPDVINNLSFIKRPLYVWLEKVKYYLYDSRLSGFGPLWFILFLPGTALMVSYALIRKRMDLLFAGLILFSTFILHPRNWNTRYVIFIVGFGAISFGFILDYFERQRNILKVPLLLLVFYTFLVSNSPCVMPGKVKEFIALPPNERTIARQAPLNIELQTHQEYGHWIWISNNVSGGDTLAYTFEPMFHLPLWNMEFSNRIVYVKSDSYNEWVQRLKKEDATYVLIRVRSEEDKWIEKEKRLLSSIWWTGRADERFKVEYSDKNYRILKFSGEGN